MPKGELVLNSVFYNGCGGLKPNSLRERGQSRGEASTPPARTIDLTDLLVRCDVPLSLYPHMGLIGVTTVAKLAYFLATDKELMEEIMGTAADLRGHVLVCLLAYFLHPPPIVSIPNVKDSVGETCMAGNSLLNRNRPNARHCVKLGGMPKHRC